jgi:hypothetical protein
MSEESDNKKYTLNNRDGSLREKARTHRKIFNRDYPQPEKINYNENCMTYDQELDNLKNIIRETNLKFDNIRPMFITLGVGK